MKLLLTSAGFSNKSISDALLEMVGKPFAELSLAFIPTAATVVSGDKSWLIKDFVNCQNLGFKSIDIVDISAISKEEWLPRLEAAEVLLIGGGDTFHLMNWVEKSGLRDLLPELLKNKIYVGISAGSAIVCKDLDAKMSEKLYEETPGEYGKEESLAYLDFLIYPHLNSEYFPNLKLENLEKLESKMTGTVYAVDDNSAVKVIDNKVEIISEGVWKKFN